MKGFIVLLLCLLPVVRGEVIKFREYEEHWYSWKSFYERKYETDPEEEVRYAIWRDNLRVSSLIQDSIYGIWGVEASPPKCPASPKKILSSLQYVSNYIEKIVKTRRG